MDLVATHSGPSDRRVRKLCDELVNIVAEPDIDADLPPQTAAAMALGRSGGMKGGRARAQKLSAEQLKESARHAANIRWGLVRKNAAAGERALLDHLEGYPTVNELERLRREGPDRG